MEERTVIPARGDVAQEVFGRDRGGRSSFHSRVEQLDEEVPVGGCGSRLRRQTDDGALHVDARHREETRGGHDALIGPCRNGDVGERSRRRHRQKLSRFERLDADPRRGACCSTGMRAARPRRAPKTTSLHDARSLPAFITDPLALGSPPDDLGTTESHQPTWRRRQPADSGPPMVRPARLEGSPGGSHGWARGKNFQGGPARAVRLTA